MSWIKDHAVDHPLQLPPNPIPERFREAKLSKIENEAVRTVVVKYLTHFEAYATKGVAPSFLGKGGTYKSFGAGLIADRLYRQALLPLEYVACASQMAELERARYDAATSKFLRRLRTTPFLIMDDFTQIKLGTWTTDMLLEIADARYNALLPTMWTGNLFISKEDQSSLINGYGVSFARRLMEGSKGLIVVNR